MSSITKTLTPFLPDNNKLFVNRKAKRAFNKQFPINVYRPIDLSHSMIDHRRYFGILIRKNVLGEASIKQVFLQIIRCAMHYFPEIREIAKLNDRKRAIANSSYSYTKRDMVVLMDESIAKHDASIIKKRSESSWLECLWTTFWEVDRTVKNNVPLSNATLLQTHLAGLMMFGFNETEAKACASIQSDIDKMAVMSCLHGLTPVGSPKPYEIII